MSNFAILKDFKTQGSNGPAESTSYVTRSNLVELFDDLAVSVVSGVITFTVTGVYAIRVRCQHFGPSGRRFVHILHKNGVATGIPSTPCITDGVGNWTSISWNIVSITAGDTIAVKSKTDTAASTFAGKAGNVTEEVYTEVEIEKVAASSYALFYYSKTTGNDGDAEPALYSNRDLTSSVNTIASLTESSGAVTFPLGSYRVRSLCTHFGGTTRKFIHSFIRPSIGATSNNVGNVLTENIAYQALLVAPVAYGFQSRADSISGTPIRGKQGNLGEIEVYGLVDILKF